MKMLVVLPLETRKRLEAQASREGRSMSDVIASAIDFYARERRAKR
jgi:predicted DNA-binding protein